MSDTKPSDCPRCGAPIPTGARGRLCPACLISGALRPPEEEAPPDFPQDIGDYRLLSELGAGGMGTVYEAEQLSTGRRVALKMLAGRLDSPDLRRRFLREGRLAASVNHPNSLYVFGSEEIGDAPVITMEIAGGGTLQDRLDERGPLPVDQAVDAILDAIDGLEAAAAGGVLHRDVKPSNCFVGPDGTVMVGDFGLSVSTMSKEDDSWATAAGVILGTPAFAAPEQLRGDALDARADIYSTGATLFTLLTAEAVFSGRNAVEVVANVMNRPPTPLRERLTDAPPALERVVARCLAKEPAGRYPDYASLRHALRPFSSREPEPATMGIRAAAGWIDYLIAFLLPYAPLMLSVGNEQFHFGFLMERTLSSAWPSLAVLGFGLLFFTIAEGVFGAGPGKYLLGLRVVRRDGRAPGIGRALLRVLVPVLSVEAVRIPILLATFTATRIDDVSSTEIVVYSVASALCPWIAVLLCLTARRGNGFATAWDLLSGTRVVVRRPDAARAPIVVADAPAEAAPGAEAIGPYDVVRELIPGKWIVGDDPVLCRRVWLIRRDADELPAARRGLNRAGRMRWLQTVRTAEGTWDAFEATRGEAFPNLVASGKAVSWGALRGWLHDLATELMAAVGDGTLPGELSLDHVRVSARGRAVLLDEPWPGVDAPADRIPVVDVAGRQAFLSAVASHVDETGLPLHARPVLENLEAGKFERLTFVTGVLQGLLDRPVEVSRSIRAASIFLLPVYVGTMVFLGIHQGADWIYAQVGSSAGSLALATAMLIMVGGAVAQLVALPLGTTIGGATFRLALVDARGRPASRPRRLLRWATTWLPLLAPPAVAVLVTGEAGGPTAVAALASVAAWIGAGIHAVAHPHRGLVDHLANTRLVRR